jgi:hypothetical protein
MRNMQRPRTGVTPSKWQVCTCCSKTSHAHNHTECLSTRLEPRTNSDIAQIYRLCPKELRRSCAARFPGWTLRIPCLTVHLAPQASFWGRISAIWPHIASTGTKRKKIRLLRRQTVQSMRLIPLACERVITHLFSSRSVNNSMCKLILRALPPRRRGGIKRQRDVPVLLLQAVCPAPTVHFGNITASGKEVWGNTFVPVFGSEAAASNGP